MRLVDNAKHAWKWFSVQALAFLTFLSSLLVFVPFIPVVWAEIPDDIKAMIPDTWLKYVVLVVSLAGLIGRLVPQKSAQVPPQ